MNTFNRWVAALSLAAAVFAPAALAESTSAATGGNGGAGGTATGGAATGGTANGGAATNTNNTSGVSNASGGTGGTSSASGGNVGSVSTGASTAQTGSSAATLGDITVNYNIPAGATGRSGLGVGVDPDTGHVVNDSNIKYSGTYKLKNTPEVVVGGPASGPCNGFSGGIGFSMAGIGIGANTSTVDPGCTARETARVAAMIGRIDIANAILENLPAVQAALHAKAERDRILEAPSQPALRPLSLQGDPQRFAPPAQVDPVAEAARIDATMKEQQRVALEALTRQATMAKVNDTLRFTDATGQARERTPQQQMADDAARLATEATAEDLRRLAAARSADAPAGAPLPDPVDGPARMASKSLEATATNTAARAPSGPADPDRGSGDVRPADASGGLTSLIRGFEAFRKDTREAALERSAPPRVDPATLTPRQASALSRDVDSTALPPLTGSGAQPGNMGPGNVRS